MASPPTESPTTDILSGPDVATRVVHGSLQRAGGFVALNLLSVVGAVLLLRHLGVANFGRYGTVMALLTIVQGVSDSGLSLPGSRELSLRTTAEERRDVLAHLIGLRIILTGAGALLALAFAIAAGYPQALIVGTALVGGSVLVLSVQASMLLPLAVEFRNWRLALNDVIRQALLLACFVAFTLAGAQLVPFFAAQPIAALMVLLLTPLLLERRHLVWPRWTPAQMRALAIRTLPLALSGALLMLYFRILVILMSLVERSPVQVGYFVTSARIIEIFALLPVMLVAVVVPVLSVSSRDNTARLSYVTLRMSQTLCVVGVLLAVILGTGARTIIAILGGSQYLGAASVLQIQCFALITIFLTAGWTTTLVGMGRPKALVIGGAIGVAAVAILGFALIPPMGARGAAIAAVGADAVLCGVFYAFLHQAGATSALTLDPFVRIGLCAVPALGIAVIRPLPDAVDCVVATVAFGALIVALRALPPELSQRFQASLMQ